MAEPAKRMKPGKKSAPKPAAALALDSLIHERVRLGIVSALAGHEQVSFVDLRDALGITDGNLSAHARKLEDAGYLECHKTFVERTPRTEFSLTTKGRAELKRYLDHLESIIRSARSD
jgi:DNA-binding MarR family transcriptional regulator